MADQPTVLLAHTIAATSWADPTELRDELATRAPNADVRVAWTPPESHELIPDAEVVVTSFLPSDLLAAAESLEWVQALSAGVDFYDQETLEERGVVLTSAAGVHAEPIAEQVLGYLLAFERNLHTGIRQQSRTVWQRYGGGEIRGKTLGIVGLGSIGSRVAEYGQAFGMTVIGTKRDPSTAPEAADEVYGPDDLYEVLPRSDYLVVACPLTEETRQLLGPAELGALPGDAVLVNVARGEIVREDALVHSLQQGRLGGAALDVFEEEPHPAESPLWDLSNVIVTPHMAGSTPHRAGRIADVFERNYEAYTGGESFDNRVV
jgi:phosphoglycerate dehydrogenase-like enzyme